MFRLEWREFPSAPCLAEKEKNLITDRVAMLLKSRTSLTCFRACILPGRAKDLSAVSVLSCSPESATGRCPNQMNPVHVLSSIFFKVYFNVYFNIVRHCMLRLNLDLHLWVSFTFVHVSHLIRCQYHTTDSSKETIIVSAATVMLPDIFRISV